ncbi:Zn-ribbon domain-containing OB-fold protein [Propylenella binzhouense]|uniref:Zn-ribbon domain-containing OB-fold protein n=1 Tax=Propylenella binzhouense TaxID=2555902 RepID=A0A964T6V0_9HYPH|nr:Zn-ribbon domain-containing OB-fold protein [Propylenella binzhouense]MYZ49500.1 Zn-ribbon domain-containing OB-fold protein [Propylenella binzhouense]
MDGAPDQGAEAHYRAALNQGRLLIQRCESCGKHVFFPRSICPHCWSESLAWVEPKGSGTVYSTTTVRRKPDAGGDYNVSLVDLDEGVRMMSRVDGVPPGEVKIGMRVAAEVIEEGGGGLVVFRPEGAR